MVRISDICRMFLLIIFSKMLLIYYFLLLFTELTPEQQKILVDIRRRKTELLIQIQVG